MDQYSGPTTTADSNADGRMKVAAGCSHGRKKCLKCAISKHKDGKGGPGVKTTFPTGSGGFGASSAQKTPKFSIASMPMTAKKHKSLSIPGGLKPKGGKALKFNASKTSSLMKGMKLSKKAKAPKGMKARSLKAILRGN